MKSIETDEFNPLLSSEEVSLPSILEDIENFSKQTGLSRAEVVQLVLDLDPVDLAEKIAGKPYDSGDEKVKLLAIGLSIQVGQGRQKILEALGDTSISNDLTRYLQILSLMGFELAGRFPFKGRSWDGEPPAEEILFVYGHRDLGIILVFDTYGSDHVNGGSFYYCIKMHEFSWGSRVLSSGGMKSESLPKKDWIDLEPPPEDLYWEGHHDCREAIRHKIQSLKESGKFYPIWPKYSQGKQHFGFRLMSYMDWEDPRYGGPFAKGAKQYLDELFAERYNALADFAKTIIGDPTIVIDE